MRRLLTIAIAVSLLCWAPQLAAQRVQYDTSTVQYKTNPATADTVAGLVLGFTRDFLGLAGWSIGIYFRVPELGGKPDSTLAGATYVEPQYRYAVIEFDLDYLMTVPWITRMEVIIHECVHIPVWQLALEADNDYLEERLVTELSYALLKAMVVTRQLSQQVQP